MCVCVCVLLTLAFSLVPVGVSEKGGGGGGGGCGACVLHTNSNIAVIEHYCIMCICIPLSEYDKISSEFFFSFGILSSPFQMVPHPPIPPYPAH